MKLGMLLSLLANIGLVISLAVVSRNTNRKINEAVEKATLEDIKDCGQAIKTVVKIGYLGGCMNTISEVKHVEQGDPLIPVYQDYCMQGAKAMADKVELK